MEIFVTDSTYKPDILIDEFISFIWTEKYNSYGEFRLQVQPTTEMKTLLSVGKVLSISTSDRLMIIDESLTKKDEEGKMTLEVSGRSMEAFLEERSISHHMYNNDTDDVWQTSGYPGNIVVLFVNETCVSGTASALVDVIPEFDAVNTSSNTDIMRVAMKPQSLYSAVKTVCDSVNLGFMIRRRETSPYLRFDCYDGVERPDVVFSSSMDMLSEETHLDSQTNHKNVAYVWGRDRALLRVVLRTSSSPNPQGWDRRVLHVDASDIDPATSSDLSAELLQRGREALAEHERAHMFDGKVAWDNPFRYRQDYFLGDTVYLMDTYGDRHATRVTEYIWAHDEAGYRSYPTFTAL